MTQLCEIIFADDDATTEIVDPMSSARICYNSSLPLRVLARLRGYEGTQLVTSLHKGVVSLEPFYQKGVLVILKHRTSTIHCLMREIQCVPPFAMTADKSEGLTVDGMVLYPLRLHIRQTPQKNRSTS